MSAYRVLPASRNKASTWLRQVHRHLKKPVTGWLFGVWVLRDDAVVGVAMAGRPKARLLQDGETCEITRVAVLEGNPNACSVAYGCLRRAAVALGYQRVYTYTRFDEEGASVRAAGFVDDGPAGGGEWDRPARPRGAAEDNVPRRRWVWPASARRKER